jgi:hypothetical protein
MVCFDLNIDVSRCAKDDKATYAPFGRLANTTMRLFHDTIFPEIPRLGNTDDEIVFHTNDPRHIQSENTGAPYGSALASIRGLKPDLVVIPMSFIREAFPISTGLSLHEYVEQHATLPPRKDQIFSWQRTFCSIEGKLGKLNRNLTTLPRKWEVGPLREDLPNDTAPGGSDVGCTSDQGEEPPTPKLLAVPEELDLDDHKRTTGIMRAFRRRPHPSNHPPSAGNQRKRKELSEVTTTTSFRSQKRSRFNEDQKLGKSQLGRIALGDDLQVAHYASERLSASIAISHAINLYYNGA